VASAAKAAAAAAAAPRGTSVRLVLCSAERPTERKIVVLPRSAGVAELLKLAKAKLRLKRPPPGALTLTLTLTLILTLILTLALTPALTLGSGGASPNPA